MNIFNKPIFWVAVIFFFAAAFRLTSLDLIEFKLDEANTYSAAVKFYSSPYIPQNSGVSSSTLYNMPLFYDLIIILAVFARDPLVISVLIALINTFLVSIFYLVVKRYYGNLVAILSSIILATSPWMILYSRKIWGPDLIMLFAVPFFFFLHRLIIDKKPGSVFGLSLSLVLLSQLHYSGVLLLLITAVILMIYKVKVSWKGLGLGIFLGLIPVVPYLAMGNFTCTECIATQMEKSFDAGNLFRGLQLINGSHFENVLGEDYTVFLNQFPLTKIFSFLFIFEFFLFPVGIWVIAQNKRFRFLLIYLVVIPLIYLVTQTPARMYYFLILTPFLMLIYAFAVQKVFELRSFLGVTVIALIVILNSVFMLSFNQFLSEKQVIAGDYGPIFKVTSQKAEEQLTQYKGKEDFDLIKAQLYLDLTGRQQY